MIPTYNRVALLRKAIEGYLAHSVPASIRELLIVDDGSTDDTAAMVAGLSEHAPFPIRYLRQSNKGPAAARNFGIREARSPIILFTDSDIVPARDLVAQHLAWHQKNPELSAAVLGYVTWPSEPKPTPFMKWYGEYKLFSYGELQHRQEVKTPHLFTCNVSLKTDFLRTCGQFDEDFKTAAFEDIELAYRLGKSGLRLFYNAQAIGYHHQFFTFASVCRKARANKDATLVFLRKEAGQRILAPRIRRRSHLWFRLAKWSATTAAVALTPARQLLDSYIPLPHLIYRLFLWNDTTRVAEISVSQGAEIADAAVVGS